MTLELPLPSLLYQETSTPLLQRKAVRTNLLKILKFTYTTLSDTIDTSKWIWVVCMDELVLGCRFMKSPKTAGLQELFLEGYVCRKRNRRQNSIWSTCSFSLDQITAFMLQIKFTWKKVNCDSPYTLWGFATGITCKLLSTPPQSNYTCL